MRIDLTNSGLQSVDSAATNRTAPRAAAARETGDPAHAAVAIDHAQFSFDQARIQSLTAHVLSAPEVREAKVASLTQAIESGQYTLDAARIAGAMVSAYGGTQLL